MKTQNVIATIILAMVIVLGIVAICCASPWLVCDPAPTEGRTHFVLTGWTPTTIPAESNGSIRMDVASAVVGTTNLTIRACNTWGCSTPVAYPLVRPASVSVPVNIQLAP